MKQSGTRRLYVAAITILLALCLGGLMACNSGEATDTESTEAPETVCSHAYKETVTDATCMDDGSKVHTCSLCGDVITETLPALGHAYETVTTEPTCTVDGSKVTACSRCGDTATEVLPAHGHSYVETVVDATCTEDGCKTNTCSVCQDVITETIPAHGHSYVETVVDATCTEDGCKTNTCSVCQDVITETIPAHGHRYEETVVEATCTEDGCKTNTCSVCQDVITETIPAHGHRYEETVVEATCTEDGCRTNTCSVCGDTVTETLSALGHNTKTKTTKATCTKAGKKVTTCSRCSYEKIETLKALGHDLKETNTATCEADGHKITTCSRCDYSTSEAVAALGHDHKETVTQPTCTARGKTVTTCTRCDYKKTKYASALGHDYKDYVCQRKGCGHTNIYYVRDFDAVGDGVTNDGPAICLAINTARASGGKLIFEKNKTYYIGTCPNRDGNFTSPFLFSNRTGVTIDGQGCTFRMSPELTYLVIWGSSDIVIRNCNFDYSHSVYMVGTVKKISGNTVVFSTDIEPYKTYYDYSGMTAFSVVRQTAGVQGYPHGFINTMNKTGSKEVTVTYRSGMSYSVGQVVYLPNPGIAHTGNVAAFIGGNTGDITLENVKIHAARTFTFQITGNEGDIYLKNVDLAAAPGNNRAIKMVGWRDGYHCKDNRGALHWSNCENDVVFDDVMNIRMTLGAIKSVSNRTQFVAINVESSVSFDAKPGDILDFYDQINDVYYGYARVKTATVSGNTTVITLDPTYCTVDMTKVNLTNCRVGNHMTCAPGSTIKNCTFRGSYRFVRDLTVENSTLYCLSLWILAEGGVEGTIPGNVTFRNCTFRYGTMQIDGYNRWDTGRYIPNIAAQITGIRAYDCSYQNGFKVTSSTGCYLEKYVNGVLQADPSALRPNGYVTRTDYKTPTAAQLSAGYTYNFAANNAMCFTGTPQNGYPVINQYTTLSKINPAAADAMRAAGFGENVFFYNNSVYLHTLTDKMKAGQRYQITMKVYDCTGNLATLNPADSVVLLLMTDGVQKESQVNYTCKTDPNDKRIVTLTYTFTVGLNTTDDFLLFYRIQNPTEFYIGSLTVRQY